MTPAEEMLNAVVWEVVEHDAPPGGDLPYATHSGVMRIFDIDMRCYRLNTGQAIIHADDMAVLLNRLSEANA